MSTRTHSEIDSPVGPLTVVATDGALSGLYFDSHLRRPARATFGERADAGFEAVRDQLGEYFAGTLTSFDLALAPEGDEFKQRVWALLREIGVRRDPRVRRPRPTSSATSISPRPSGTPTRSTRSASSSPATAWWPPTAV